MNSTETNKATSSKNSQLGLGTYWLRGIAGAAVGGALGWWIFDMLLSGGNYALAIPPATLALGFGYAAGRPNWMGGLFCALAGLLLMLVLEWKYFPFIADGSFSYFLTHLFELKKLTIAFLIFGTLCGFWFGRGR